MFRITVTPLAAAQIDSAYPLVREVAPDLTAAAWRRYARRAIGAAATGRAGILAARREGRPFPCGLVCYRKDEDLARGTVLVASHFVALDILDPHPYWPHWWPNWKHWPHAWDAPPSTPRWPTTPRNSPSCWPTPATAGTATC